MFRFGSRVEIKLNDSIVGLCDTVNNLYLLYPVSDSIFNSSDQSELQYNFVTHKRKNFSFDRIQLWHHRPGHIGVDNINHLARDGLIDCDQEDTLPICEPCVQCKSTRNPFSKIVGRANK